MLLFIGPLCVQSAGGHQQALGCLSLPVFIIPRLWKPCLSQLHVAVNKTKHVWFMEWGLCYPTRKTVLLCATDWEMKLCSVLEEWATAQTEGQTECQAPVKKNILFSAQRSMAWGLSANMSGIEHGLTGK